MYSMNKVSSLAHAHLASRSWVPWLYSVFGVFCTWLGQQAESRSLQLHSSRAALGGYSQNFLAGRKTRIQQEDLSKPPRLIISQKKKKEDETWVNSQRQEDSYWWGGHTGDTNCSPTPRLNAQHHEDRWFAEVAFLPSSNVFYWTRHCASSSLLHSCEHCIDPRTQYYLTSILDRVPN